MSTTVDPDTTAATLAHGAEGLGVRLDGRQIERFRLFHSELVEWNSRVNLTSVTDWEQVQARHFLDSLAVAAALPPGLAASGGRVLDVGSGAGFPGLPLRLALPGLHLSALDSTAKKTAFLSHVVAKLGLDGVDVLTGRAETLAHDPTLRESFDVVVARSVAALSVLAELTLPFCRPGGIVVAHKSRGVESEVARAGAAIHAMGGSLREVLQTGAADGVPAGALVVLDKPGRTPDRYPRRPGIPAKRPL